MESTHDVAGHSLGMHKERIVAVGGFDALLHTVGRGHKEVVTGDALHFVHRVDVTVEPTVARSVLGREPDDLRTAFGQSGQRHLEKGIGYLYAYSFPMKRGVASP